MHHPWRPTASLRILEPKLPRNQVVIWSLLLFIAIGLAAQFLFRENMRLDFFRVSMYIHVVMYCISIPIAMLRNHDLTVSKYWRKHSMLVFCWTTQGKHLNTSFAYKQWSPCLPPPSAHHLKLMKTWQENPLTKMIQKNLGLQKTKRTQLGSGILSGMIWDDWCVTRNFARRQFTGPARLLTSGTLGR